MKNHRAGRRGRSVPVSRREFLGFGFAAIGGASLVLPCASRAHTAAQPDKAAPSAAKRGKTITLAYPRHISTIDPRRNRITDEVNTYLHVYDPLVAMNQKLEVVPALAESWERVDLNTWRFRLRKGPIKFHNGEDLTAVDVKFSLERAGVNPFKGAVLPRGAAFETVSKIETPDDHTVVLTLKYASGEIMEVLAAGFNLMLPKHIIEPLGSGKIRKAEQIVGTGPFKAKSYDIGVGWELVRSDSYFKKGLPYLDGIRYYIIKDDATRFEILRSRANLLARKANRPDLANETFSQLNYSPISLYLLSIP